MGDPSGIQRYMVTKVIHRASQTTSVLESKSNGKVVPHKARVSFQLFMG